MQEDQIPQTPTVDSPQITVAQVVDQTPKKNNFLVILLSLLLSITVIIAGFFAYQTQKLAKELLRVKNEESIIPTLLPSTKPTADPMKNWKTYRDEKVGFEFKYPSNITVIGETKGSDSLSLNIKTKNLSNYIDDPMGFTLEIASSDKKSLEKGEYGYKGFGQNFAGSQRVVTLDKTFGKIFIAFQEIEVCNVQFTRGLIFFKDNYQVIVRLQAPLGYAKLMPEYFTLDDKSCGGSPVWKSTENFYSDLINNKAPQVATEWYTLFDQIISTFKFTN